MRGQDRWSSCLAFDHYFVKIGESVLKNVEVLFLIDVLVVCGRVVSAPPPHQKPYGVDNARHVEDWGPALSETRFGQHSRNRWHKHGTDVATELCGRDGDCPFLVGEPLGVQREERGVDQTVKGTDYDPNRNQPSVVTLGGDRRQSVDDGWDADAQTAHPFGAPTLTHQTAQDLCQCEAIEVGAQNDTLHRFAPIKLIRLLEFGTMLSCRQ